MPNLSPSITKHYLPPFPWDLDMLPFVLLRDHGALPQTRGVYFFRTPGEVLYIGATTCLQQRLAYHNHLPALNEIPHAVFIAWMPCPFATKKGLEQLEKQAIAHYKPLMNCTAGRWLPHAPFPSEETYAERSARRFRAILRHLLADEYFPS